MVVRQRRGRSRRARNSPSGQIEFRWDAGDVDRSRKEAAELVALSPDVILALGGSTVASLLQATRAVPIVFVHVPDPVGASAAKQNLPAIYTLRSFSAAGGLLYYGINPSDQYPRAASYVDRILRGEKPGDLPVQAPTKFQLVINLKAAKALAPCGRGDRISTGDVGYWHLADIGDGRFDVCFRG